ncbi:MAG: hypothetical protein CMA31_01675 [Euryarchaeota archaeon]|nr:hypothetical protein [Euryarchaeota archaeon]|tara:strand:+ start:4903 stop:5997 length:1095 start_codon:yes stop_codon:yes gene_type:complete
MDEFEIEEKTLEQLLQLKENDGFKNKSWDEWFRFSFKIKSKSTVNEIIENVEERFFDDNHFDRYVKNFTLNLEQISKQPSARILDPEHNSEKLQTESAIVIGRGPSMKKHNHLDILAKSNFDGCIVCTDGALIKTLESGVTPEKFPNFFVVTVDTEEDEVDFFDDKIVDKYGGQINGIFSVLVDPKVIKRAIDAKIKIHWIHPLFDLQYGKKSFNSISALIVRTKKEGVGLPAIQTGGNVGTASWFVGWQILKCKTVGLIGINHGWEEDDTWETIISHGNVINPGELDKESETFKKLFPKIFNPDFNSYCILDPTFQYYSNALKEFISRAPKHVNTINATEGGSIFGDRITSMKLEDFLSMNRN